MYAAGHVNGRSKILQKWRMGSTLPSPQIYHDASPLTLSSFAQDSVDIKFSTSRRHTSPPQPLGPSSSSFVIQAHTATTQKGRSHSHNGRERNGCLGLEVIKKRGRAHRWKYALSWCTLSLAHVQGHQKSRVSKGAYPMSFFSRTLK